MANVVDSTGGRKRIKTTRNTLATTACLCVVLFLMLIGFFLFVICQSDDDYGTHGVHTDSSSSSSSSASSVLRLSALSANCGL